MRKRSFAIKGHRTSVALEPEFWDALEALARREGLSLSALIAKIDRERIRRDPQPGLASALRVFALNSLRAQDP